MFMNDFGIHRNMYRVLKKFNWIPACLPYEKRRKLANVFTLTLGPHDAESDIMIDSFAKHMKNLNKGTSMHIESQVNFICAYTMNFLSDMPAQADSAGMMRHTAKFGCRRCFCFKEKRDFSFDVLNENRSHRQAMKLKQENIKR